MSATQNDKVLPQNAAISHAFVGQRANAASPSLQLTQVNRRSKYWTKAGIKLYIYMPCQSSHPDCTSYKIVFLASADSSTSLTHTHTHRHLSHLCAHFCGTRGTVWQLTPFFGKVQTLLSFRFWLNSFTLSLCFIVCLSAAQNGCMKATYTSISSEAAFR